MKNAALIAMTFVLMSSLGCSSVETAQPAGAYDGEALYVGHCASCHGADGGGDGPIAKLLIRQVPDLRAMQMTNKLEIIQVIDGRGIRATHGSQDMPVWGWAFREVERSETEVQARLEALAEYILTLKQ